MKIFLFLTLIAVSLSGAAQPAPPTAAPKVELNKVLFSIGPESWTLRDRQAYQAVLTDLFQKKSLSQFSKDNENDFLLSRLGYREASVFDLSGAKLKINEAARKKLSTFTAAELDREINYISKAFSIIEIKETQQKDTARFNTWYELLKRKYQVRMK